MNNELSTSFCPACVNEFLVDMPVAALVDELDVLHDSEYKRGIIFELCDIHGGLNIFVELSEARKATREEYLKRKNNDK